jgi:hypothetical protein
MEEGLRVMTQVKGEEILVRRWTKGARNWIQLLEYLQLKRDQSLI